MSEGNLKRRIRKLDPILNLKGTEHCWASLPELFKIIDEAKKEFGKIILVQALGKRNDDCSRFVVDESKWSEVIKDCKEEGRDCWFEFEYPDKAVKAFLKFFGDEK